MHPRLKITRHATGRRALYALLALGGLWIQPSLAEGHDATGLRFSAAGDILATLGGSSGARIEPREAELMVFAPIDPYFDGVLNLAAHNELGQTFFEIHELVISSSRLIPRSRFRIGQFFLGFGRLNQFHRHDWPFTSAPKVQTEFFYNEAVIDTGLEYSWLTPLPFYLELTFGITNGWIFGHSHTQGFRPMIPTHYVRITNYQSVGSGGIQAALNYVGRKDSAGEQKYHLGVDVTGKWKESETLKFLLQSEVWLQHWLPVGSSATDRVGFYVYPQYGFDPQWYFGLRVDGFTNLSLELTPGEKAANLDIAIVPVITFKPSEFSTFRASYNFKTPVFPNTSSTTEHIVELQATFLLGAHPAHDF